MSEIILYSTLGCHLCELALQEIEPVLMDSQWLLKEIDIAEDLTLLEAYGTSIPVLHYPKKNKQLYWPFDNLQVKQFLEND